MWLLVFLFLCVTAGLGWTLFGYFLVTWFRGRFRDVATPELTDDELPYLAVLVPCYQEEEQILEKLEDLRALDYPRDRLRVLFLDGGSKDQTCELLRGALREDEPYQLIECPQKGKINQLNLGLSMLGDEQVVVNTDVDARLEPDCLRQLAAELSVPEVWVAGAYSYPSPGLRVDEYYWQAQNKGRLLETDAGSTSIVIAQCYAFRRELMQSFPTDVVADDIYVAFLANSEGHRAVYSRGSIALETRGPLTTQQFLAHKFRKSNASLRESLRFLYRLPDMPGSFKVLFLTRAAQQLFLPWGIATWVLLMGTLLTLFRFDIVLFALVLLFASFVATSSIFSSVETPRGPKKFSFFITLYGFLLTNVIMVMTALSYPFYRQGSSYSRLPVVGKAEEEQAEEEQAEKEETEEEETTVKGETPSVGAGFTPAREPESKGDPDPSESEPDSEPESEAADVATTVQGA